MISWKMFLVRTFQTQFLSPKFSHMKRMIAIFLTATIMMFAVSPAFADDTGKKSPQIATTIADVNFEAVYLLDDLAPPVLVARTEANTTVSLEDYRPEIACAATLTSKHNQEKSNICRNTNIQTAIATAGNITAANYVINRAAKNTPIIQANTPQAQCKDATATTRPEGCECDIVVTIEISSEEVILTAPDAATEVPSVVPRE